MRGRGAPQDSVARQGRRLYQDLARDRDREVLAKPIDRQGELERLWSGILNSDTRIDRFDYLGLFESMINRITDGERDLARSFCREV